MKRHKLAFWKARQNAFDTLRDLTDAEESAHATYTPVIAEARNRLGLFRILDANYKEWNAYLASLLTAGKNDDRATEDELNRLALNYLTFAYTIREHFEVSFRQRFKKDASKLAEYTGFLQKLCDQSWPFAFICDFRGYVQHVGLAIGAHARNETRSSVTISITVDSAQLVSESKDWKKSKLTAPRGTIDLIEVFHEFHVIMMQSYALYAAKTFFPELMAASEFYSRLTDEVKISHPDARMVLHEGEPRQSESNGKVSIDLKIVMVPNDVYGELGIKYKKK